MRIISGNSNEGLALDICQTLKTKPTKSTIKRFSDNEIFVEINENVRGDDVFIIQSTSYPANDHMMELLIIIDAVKRSSASRITAVLPYYGYARQDRKSAPRTPISAKLVANLITKAGADRLLSVDLHAGQIQGFFDIPTDNLYASPVLVEDMKESYEGAKIKVVSPDIGGVTRARNVALQLGCDLAVIDKRRPQAGVSEVMNIIGNVEGYTCIMVDDIVDSAGTLCNAANSLLDHGAASVVAYVTHGVLSGKAYDNIDKSGIHEVVITDTIAPTRQTQKNDKIRVITIAPLMAEAIKRIACNESVSSLFI